MPRAHTTYTRGHVYRKKLTAGGTEGGGEGGREGSLFILEAGDERRRRVEGKVRSLKGTANRDAQLHSHHSLVP